MDPGIGLRQLPRLISRLESLCHSQCHCLRHFSLGAEKSVTLHRLVQIRRNERENMIVCGIRRAVRDPETNRYPNYIIYCESLFFFFYQK